MEPESSFKTSWCLLLALISVCTPIQAASSPGDTAKVRIATGPNGGAYHELGVVLSNEISGGAIDIVLVSTAGTIDNLERLASHSVDFAIIQNDIGHYVSSGKYGYQEFDGFSALLPLFAEQIQIVVREDGDIRILGDLQQKTVALGPRGSGVHRNALDLLRGIELRPNVDFRAAYLDSSEAFRQLLDGSIDAAFYTGAKLPISIGEAGDRLRSLPLSADLIAELSLAQPYYTVGAGVPSSVLSASGEPSLFVMAYLVASDDVPDEVVHKLVSLIVDSWPDIEKRSNNYSLIPLGQSLLKRPFPYHESATDVFVHRGLLENNRSNLYALIVTSLLLLVVWWANHQSKTYDRLGNATIGSGGWYGWLLQKIARVGTVLYIIIGFFLIVTVMVYSIRYFESQYASSVNIENDFANIGFEDALLWMFMFMGSGETGDIFPLSTPGKVLVTLIPAMGFSTLLGSFLLYAERQRKARTERLRGTLTRRLRDHVMICGWNEKVPGIIYALTSSDAPERKHVVVVAELDGDAPLEHYQFDPRYVSYCRGNSIDHSSLMQASVGEADSAFVVAGFRKRKNQNLESVLTVMALKEARRQSANHGKRDIYVAAEMIHDANRERFEICNVDALVHGTTIVDRLLAQSSFGRYIMDYVLDVLTYDDFDEIHSLKVEYLREIPFKRVVQESNLIHGIKQFVSLIANRSLNRYDPNVLVGMSIDRAKRALGIKGINLIGTINAGREHQAFIDHTFDEDSPYKLWLTNPEHKIESSDVLIFCAADRHDIYPALINLRDPTRGELPKRGTFEIKALRKRRIAIVGNEARANVVRKLFDGISDHVELSMFSIAGAEFESGTMERGRGDSPYQLRDMEELVACDVDAVLITNDLASDSTFTSDDDLRAIDADTLFASRKICTAMSESGDPGGSTSPAIVAQMVGRENRQLFDDAGIDVSVPRSLLVERTLAKLAHSKGDVANLLLALLAFDDGIHLRAVKVDPICHSELLGRTFGEMMYGLATNMQLIAWLPGAARDELKNDLNDFDWHFITSPNRIQDKKYKCAVGDVLVIIINSRQRKPVSQVNRGGGQVN